MNRRYLIFALGLVVYGVSLRLLPHLPNFAPLTALAVFSGAVLPRKFAIVTPLLAAIVSDLLIGTYGSVMFVVWGCYAAIALAVQRYGAQPSFTRGVACIVASSVGFFLATNLAVWAFGSMYTHTWAGLQQCYTLALPFFRNSLLGDLAYSAVLFGLYVGLRSAYLPRLREVIQ